jgi:hypothetical protein
MWMEGTLGVAQDMLPTAWNGTELDEGRTWGNNTAKFAKWWRDHGHHHGRPAMVESKLIRNYGEGGGGEGRLQPPSADPSTDSEPIPFIIPFTLRAEPLSFFDPRAWRV